MSKFSNPLGGNNQVWITQTYHGNSNTAIDCYGYRYQPNMPVYAIADGKVGNYYLAGGSWITQYLDNSDMRIWYVHIWHCVPNGSYVKKGQKIGEVAPCTVNGGHDEHLHLGLTPKDKYIMNYFDRSIPFKTKCATIKANWFKSDGTLNWSRFKDLSYTNDTMPFKKGDKIIFTGEQNIRKGSGTSYPVTGSAKVGMTSTIEGEPRIADNYTWYDLVDNNWVADVGKFKIYVAPVEPPVTPDCSKYKKQIITLTGENKNFKIALGALQKQLEALEVSLELCKKQKADIDTYYKKQVEDLENKALEQEVEAENKYDSLRSEKDRISGERTKCQLELDKLKEKSCVKQVIDDFFDWLKGLKK